MIAPRRAASRPAKTVVVAVVVAADYCRGDGSRRTAAGDRPVGWEAAPATAGNRCQSQSDAVPHPAATGRTAADHVAPAVAAGERRDPSPRASCPTPPASHATYIARNPRRSIFPDLAPPRPGGDAIKSIKRGEDE